MAALISEASVHFTIVSVYCGVWRWTAIVLLIAMDLDGCFKSLGSMYESLTIGFHYSRLICARYVVLSFWMNMHILTFFKSCSSLVISGLTSEVVRSFTRSCRTRRDACPHLRIHVTTGPRPPVNERTSSQHSTATEPRLKCLRDRHTRAALPNLPALPFCNTRPTVKG